MASNPLSSVRDFPCLRHIVAHSKNLSSHVISTDDLSNAKFNLGNEFDFQSHIISHECELSRENAVPIRALLSAANHECHLLATRGEQKFLDEFPPWFQVVAIPYFVSHEDKMKGMIRDIYLQKLL